MREGEPVKPGEVNWVLLRNLADRPHKLIDVPDVAGDPFATAAEVSANEILKEARTAHHLLDLAGIPLGEYDAPNLDARVYLAIQRLLEHGSRLERIASWHSRESGEGGTVGSFCVECAELWPCDTRKMADGTWTEDDDDAMGAAFEGMEA